jgi:sialate O-acetylesterase
MVLQHERPLPIWGWADPGEEVTVRLDEATAITKSDSQGDWNVVLPAVKADGNAHTMTIRGKNKIELDDLLIGDARIGSGQSNMEFSLAGSTGGKEAVAAADCPQIRLDSSYGGSSIEAWYASGRKSGLYNAMIAPVKPLAIRGAIWDQDEKNVALNVRSLPARPAIRSTSAEVLGSSPSAGFLAAPILPRLTAPRVSTQLRLLAEPVPGYA